MFLNFFYYILLELVNIYIYLNIYILNFLQNRMELSLGPWEQEEHVKLICDDWKNIEFCKFCNFVNSFKSWLQFK